MKYQIVKMDVNEILYRVINDTKNNCNPLSVYREWKEYRDGTYPLKHKRLLARYQDLNSCMCMILSDIHHKEMVIVAADALR